MTRGVLWVATTTLALASCGGNKPPPAESASDAPASEGSSPEPAGEASSEEATSVASSDDTEPLDAWTKRANAASGKGSDPFPDAAVGFALGMAKSEVRQVCEKAKGKIMDSLPLRCSFDAVLSQAFKGTPLWLDQPRRGWADGGVSVQLDDEGNVCGISVSLSGSGAGSVVVPSALLGSLGAPTKVLDVREARVVRWHWSGKEHEAFASWSHHLPSYQGSAGQRQWVSYCKRSIMKCRAFCSYLE